MNPGTFNDDPGMYHSSVQRGYAVAEKPSHENTAREITRLKEQLVRLRKDSEQALEEALLRTRLILETAMDGFYILDLQGRIIQTNRTGSAISGYPVEEMQGMPFSALEDPDSPTHIGSHLRRAMELGADRFETIHRSRDGRIVHLRVGIHFVTLNNEQCFFAFSHDITNRKEWEHKMRQRERELETKTSNLEEANIALNVLLKRRQEDKLALEEKVLSNVKELIFPYLEKLQASGLDERQKAYADILTSNLNEITSPFLRRLSHRYLNFTPAEIEVANLVKHGKTSKEIAGLLHLSTETVASHRKSIRKKMGINRRKANLRTHLLSLQE